jgi:hypothetical protein
LSHFFCFHFTLIQCATQEGCSFEHKRFTNQGINTVPKASTSQHMSPKLKLSLV